MTYFSSIAPEKYLHKHICLLFTPGNLCHTCWVVSWHFPVWFGLKANSKHQDMFSVLFFALNNKESLWNVFVSVMLSLVLSVSNPISQKIITILWGGDFEFIPYTPPLNITITGHKQIDFIEIIQQYSLTKWVMS